MTSHQNKLKHIHGDPGYTMDHSFYRDKYESTDMYEDPNTFNDRNREVIQDYRPVKPLFEHEQPRKNNFSKQYINLRTEGAMTGTMPWRDDEFDMQFHDKDPRGTENMPLWRKFRENGTPRMKLHLFGNDNDYSIPGQGISPTDMVSRMVELRRQLRGRINWFSESIVSMAAGRQRTENTYGGTDMRKIIFEDTSVAADPTLLDAVGRQNVNRILSNNVHVGSKYFVNKTITDHVVPTHSYHTLFKSWRPSTPRQLTDMILQDQPINQLGDRTTRTTFIRQFDPSSPVNKCTAERSRFEELYEMQSNPEKSKLVVRDIMSLIGITEQEIRWVQSMESSNRQVYEQCAANLIDMIQVLEQLPPNARLDIRNQLMENRTQLFRGGMCEQTIEDRKNTYRLIDQHNPHNRMVQHTGKFNGKTNVKWGRSIGGVNGKLTNQRDGGGSDRKQRYTPAIDYTLQFKNKRVDGRITNNLPREMSENTFTDTETTRNVQRILTGANSIKETLQEIKMGEEHTVDIPLNSYNDHRHIPRQYKNKSLK